MPRERGVTPATGWRLVDALLAVGLLTAVIITDNLEEMPSGLEAFLAIRVTLKNVLLLTAFGLAWPGVLSLCGLYAPKRLRTGTGELPRLMLAGLIGMVLALAFPLTSHSGAARSEHAVLFAVMIVPAAATLRGAVRMVHRWHRTSESRNVVIVGSGPLAARVLQGLGTDPFETSVVVGFVDSEPQVALGGKGGPMHLGGIDELERILMHRVVDDVLIGLPIKSRYEEIQRTLGACERVGVPVKYPADLFQASQALPRLDISAIPPVHSPPMTQDDFPLVVKRTLDILGALVLLIGLAPLMIGVALAVKLTSPGPVLFGQERYGYRKRRFRMYKFRTMVADAEQRQSELEDLNEASGPVFKIRDDPRVTALGRFLRRSSLDELPQIWHVLTGEMSLVGPRPLPVRDVRRFEHPWLMRRFSVRPGLTCLWQISGRSELRFDRWIVLDLEYIDRWSLSLDLMILLKTIPAVLRGAGAA